MNMTTEINQALKEAYNADYIPLTLGVEVKGEIERLQSALKKRGLCIMPVPEREIHDIDRLIRAEEIIALQSKILVTSANEIFTEQRNMVGKRNKMVLEYFEEYGVSNFGTLLNEQ